ncbi:MAG: flagellar basal body P-ring formation protein FlgA [Deltaproteobacteria bacterium]|nr:flagellar basal body P-ring formation protein FlgA [Deltaproteobacteria bacterium]
MNKALLIFFILLTVLAGAAHAEVNINAEIKRQLLENSPWDEGQAEVEDIQIPGLTGDEKYDEAIVRIPNGAKNTGKVAVQVTLMLNGKEVKNTWASARVRIYKTVVVAINTLKMNHKVTKDDLRLVRTEMRDMPDALTSLDEAEGMMIKRPISAGTVVKKDYLKPETMIKRGERIIVWISSDKIKVKTGAVAMQDGYKGGVLTARSASGKEISGKVTGQGELAVEF